MTLGVLRVYFQNEVHPTNNYIIRSYTMQNNITSCKRCTYVLFFKKTKRRYLMTSKFAKESDVVA